MKYNIRGNKIDVTEAIDNYIKEKLSRLDKYLDDNDEVEAKAVISARGKDQKVEVTIWSGKYNIRAEETNPEIEDLFEEDEQHIVRRKEVFLKPIDEEEAITQMELLGHTFFVFKNVDTDKINVVYKRNDGDYGIIEAN